MVYIYYKGARFGNWLFQYAVAKSLANGRSVAWYFERPDESHVLDPYMGLFKGIEIVYALPKDTIILTDALVDKKGLERYKNAPNVALLGFFQKPRYFDDAIVRAAFQIPQEIDREIHLRCKAMFEVPDRVSIHVRRGDYLKLPHRFPFVGESYLKTAVERFPSTSLFVVCSDDMPWCKQFFSHKRFPGRRFYFVEGGTCLSDFFTITYCQHNICSNSTFSWWASWLNSNPEKHVIMPRRWFGIDIRRTGECYYYKGVEVVDNPLSFKMFFQMWFREARAVLGRLARGCRR